jgi:hypothetical protein
MKILVDAAGVKGYSRPTQQIRSYTKYKTHCLYIALCNSLRNMHASLNYESETCPKRKNTTMSYSDEPQTQYNAASGGHHHTNQRTNQWLGWERASALVASA